MIILDCEYYIQCGTVGQANGVQKCGGKFFSDFVVMILVSQWWHQWWHQFVDGEKIMKLF